MSLGSHLQCLLMVAWVAVVAFGAKLPNLRTRLANTTALNPISFLSGSAAATAIGCASAAHLPTGDVFNRTLLWQEDGLPSVLREYSVYIPRSYRPGEPSGLALVFHGWGDPSAGLQMGMGPWPNWYHSFYGYREAAESSGFITVYPVGLSDCQGKDCFDKNNKRGYESWNAGGTTASRDGDTVNCDLSVEDGDYCYGSTALRKGGCHKCDWTTGYDDVGFVRHLVDELKSSLCVDPKRIFATGCSNGGMFVHDLAQHLPGTFAAVAANCAGKPHKGFETLAEGPPVSMMLVTGKQDQTLRGFENSVGNGWWDGFKYASRADVFEAYRVHNRCPREMVKRSYNTMQAVRRPSMRMRGGLVGSGTVLMQDGAEVRSADAHAGYHEHSMSCYQLYYGCAGNSSLVSCEWDGGHDIMQGEPSAAYAFFAEHPRN